IFLSTTSLLYFRLSPSLPARHVPAQYRRSEDLLLAVWRKPDDVQSKNRTRRVPAGTFASMKTKRSINSRDEDKSARWRYQRLLPAGCRPHRRGVSESASRPRRSPDLL